jgi:hypothetical protein
MVLTWPEMTARLDENYVTPGSEKPLVICSYKENMLADLGRSCSIGLFRLHGIASPTGHVPGIFPNPEFWACAVQQQQEQHRTFILSPSRPRIFLSKLPQQSLTRPIPHQAVW